MTLLVSIVVEQLRRRVAGGVGRYTRGLLDGLTALDDPTVAVELVASRAGGPDPLAGWGWPVRAGALPGPALTRLWDRGWDRPKLAGVAHATSFAYPRTRGPLVVTVHDLAFREVPDAFPRRGRRWHERRLAETIGRADRMVVPAARTARALVGAGADPSKVVVIPEGSDHLPTPDHAGAQRLLLDLGIDGPFVLTVGTLEPRKNLPRLFEAYREAGLAAGGRSLVVVGPRGWGEGMAAPPAGVVLAGSPDDEVLAGLYAAAELFAYVPLAEGFGLPPVEAMRAGLAVIASTEVPSVGDAALLVDPADTRAIARALRSLGADGTYRDDLAQRGRRHTSSLTWRAAAAAHVDLWRSLG